MRGDNSRSRTSSNSGMTSRSSMLDSVVQGVSQLSMCSSSISMEDIFGKPFWDDNNEEASQMTASTHPETTATSRSNSFSDGSSPLPPSRICQVSPSVRGATSCTSCTTSTALCYPSAAAALAEPPSTYLAAGTYPDFLAHWNQSQENSQQFQSQSNVRQAQHLPHQNSSQHQQHQQPQQQHYHDKRTTQTKQSLPSTAIDLDDIDNLNESQEKAPSTPSIPATAVDLDDDIDILSYGSDELAACWDDVDDDDENDDADYTTILDDDDQEFCHQLEGYQDDPRDKVDYADDEPPLSAQTSYARQQLLQSSWYRAMQQQQQQNHHHQDDLLDEVEISRGLGGYEEGFGVPSIVHEFHSLPFKINEEPEEDDITSEDEERSVGTTEMETLTYSNQYGDDTYSHNNNDDDDDDGREQRNSKSGSIGLGSAHDSVCFHCSQGTCENEDCSGSRFMI